MTLNIIGLLAGNAHTKTFSMNPFGGEGDTVRDYCPSHVMYAHLTLKILNSPEHPLLGTKQIH